MESFLESIVPVLSEASMELNEHGNRTPAVWVKESKETKIIYLQHIDDNKLTTSKRQ